MDKVKEGVILVFGGTMLLGGAVFASVTFLAASVIGIIGGFCIGRGYRLLKAA